MVARLYFPLCPAFDAVVHHDFLAASHLYVRNGARTGMGLVQVFIFFLAWRPGPYVGRAFLDRCADGQYGALYRYFFGLRNTVPRLRTFAVCDFTDESEVSRDLYVGGHGVVLCDGWPSRTRQYL